ncbi:uncharacterized protein NPIL_94461 [Nephila pilipes]|uniref:Uncharacterized protein n=1 Tax=Nephila pilipes TaxID=299642 RepID=A0A8X6T802_NEPPI|nr:uncharacterized protein NPIL_320471 [Nephila pilipes]GFT14840.1 uncharacterized protein NPIL_94461 [Nephila pilipes]
MPEIFPFVSPLLTLGDINSSQEEMSYITRMRNVIKFQIETGEDYERLRGCCFKQRILCLNSISSTLSTCLNYTLSNVVKSHVLVHNFIPFRRWRTMFIDDDGFRAGQNPFKRREQITWRTGNVSTDRFLVTYFSTYTLFEFITWSSSLRTHSQILTFDTLDNIRIACQAIIVNSKYHTWRRVFGDNYTLFSCSEDDITSYVKEQKHRNKLVNVFETIMKREFSGPFNLFKTLESIASPYYYELPHQNQEEYDAFEVENDWCLRRNGSNYVTFSFACGLEKAAKNIT